MDQFSIQSIGYPKREIHEKYEGISLTAMSFFGKSEVVHWGIDWENRCVRMRGPSNVLRGPSSILLVVVVVLVDGNLLDDFLVQIQVRKRDCHSGVIIYRYFVSL